MIGSGLDHTGLCGADAKAAAMPMLMLIYLCMSCTAQSELPAPSTEISSWAPFR